MLRKNLVATKHVSATVANSTPLTVESGEAIWVFGILLTSIANGSTTISITTGDGAITLLTVTLVNQVNYLIDIPFKADRGLAFSNSSANAKRISVFYTGPGV